MNTDELNFSLDEMRQEIAMLRQQQRESQEQVHALEVVVTTLATRNSLDNNFITASIQNLERMEVDAADAAARERLKEAVKALIYG